MTLVLGINAYHADASACLVADGKVVAAVAEERLGRRDKHYAGFPAKAIEAVLRIGGASVADVEVAAVGHNRKANVPAKLAYTLANPAQAIRSARTSLSRGSKLQSLRASVAAGCGVPESLARFEVVEVEHHRAHLASSFFCSPFERAAGFSYDASGDFVSTMFADCSGQSIRELGKVFLPDSLGYFYTALCQFIGFDHFGEEYKVMGLAAYGTPKYMPLMETILSPAANGRFRMNPSYFSGLNQQSHADLVDANGRIVIPRLFSALLEEELGPARLRTGEITARERDVAASCQLHFENVVLHSLRWLHSEVQVENLVTAGGCALNGVCNARILRETPFRQSYIQCAAGDDGTAIGAALHVWNELRKGDRSPPLYNAYLGPGYREPEISTALQQAGLSAKRHDRAELLREIATALSKGLVVGWYQGRSEWGPRALGNRSILAHPGWPGMKDTINSKIKRREAFRPFAPSILADYVSDFFAQDIESPFMMHVVKIHPERRPEVQAVTHEDGTGRLQTVSREQNELYYDLIDTFRSLTGIPMLLNTSFNENEPIVDTPAQAISCFRRNDIDILCVGNYVVHKHPSASTSPET